ncbi:MAG: cold-shock protein [Novosphingobium sp.]|nr:cold-shock protein [Novosphingobium sp.]
MPSGRVVSFNAINGYGFICPDDGGPDCFVHLSTLASSGTAALRAGQRVTYDVLVARNGKVSAINVIRD